MVKRGKGKKKLDADLDEEIDDYEPSDSEDEFGKDEKILLDKRKGTKTYESEEEVFGIHSSDEEPEEKDGNQYYGGGVGSDLDSDIEGKGSDKDSEAGLPDSKAWGRQSKKYYDTDYVDKDYGGMSREDEEMAEMEEQEAVNIQKRLMSHMEQTDFSLGLLDKVEEKKTELSKKIGEIDSSEKIVSDLSKLSTSEKIQLLKQESPELFQLIDDFKENMGLAQDKLLPILNLVKSGKMESCPATDFVQTLFSVIINYSMNIVFYLLLKSKRSGPIDEHPVIQRLYTYKKVADEMLVGLEEKLIDQIDSIIDACSNGLELQPLPTDSIEGKKQLKILENARKTERLIERKKAKLVAKKGEERIEDILSQDDEEELEEEFKMDDDEDDEDEMEAKRAITYEMKKNKGLTPRRKKEDRNPRVKHRNKYRKAKIRRKGQVREVRTEVSKYGGELSGIKAYTSKSIKIKV